MTRQMTESALTVNARIFAFYGGLAGTFIGAIIFGSLTLGLLIGLSTGEPKVVFQTSLQELWIVKGSRAESENNFVHASFGGDGRSGQVMFSLSDSHRNPVDDNDGGLLTSANLNLFKDIVAPLLKDDTAAVYSQNGEDYRYTDFCSRPPKNTLTNAWTVQNSADYSSIFNVIEWVSKQNIASGGIGYMSQCLGTKAKSVLKANNFTSVTWEDHLQLQLWYLSNKVEIDAVLDGTSANKDAFAADRLGLTLGWGIDKYPCSRATILDCWADGDFDYPETLKEFDRYSPSLLATKGQAFVVPGYPDTNMLKFLVSHRSDRWYDSCEDQMKTSISTVIAGGLVHNGLTPGSASFNLYLSQQLALVMNTFGSLEALYGTGYWFRPSIFDQSNTTPQEMGLYENTLPKNFFVSMYNTYRSDLDANFGQSFVACVSAGLFRLTAGVKLKFAMIPNPAPFDITTMHDEFSPVPLSYDTVLKTIYGFAGGCCHNWGGVKLSPDLFLGKGSVPEDPTLNPFLIAETGRFLFSTRLATSAFSAGSTQFQARFEEERSVATASQLQDIMDNYDLVWINQLEPIWNHETILTDKLTQLDFTVDRSDADLFTDAAKVDGKLLIAGYIALVAFSCYNFITWSCPPSKDAFVYSRSMVCFIGMLMVGFSVLASFGFMGYVGLKLSPLNSMLVPFLAVGMGLADLFVLIHMTEKHSAKQDDVNQRMIVTMADAGSSITVTNAANAVAFLIPAGLVKLPAIYTFAYHMAAAIILNWITIIFLVVPIVTVDCLRAKHRRSILLPCIKAEGAEMDAAMKGDSFSLHHFVQKYLCPLYVNKIFKTFSVCLFLGATAFLGYHGFQNSDAGLLLSDVATEGTYLNNFLAKLESNYPLKPNTFIVRDVDYPNFQANILTLLDDMGNSRFVDSVNTPMSLHWLPSLIHFYYTSNPSAADDTDDGFLIIPPAAFYPTLNNWFKSPIGANSIVNFVCSDVTGFVDNCLNADGSTINITASNSGVFFNYIVTDKDYVDAINNIRDIADNSDGQRENLMDPTSKFINPRPMFFSGSLFRYWQQYTDIQDVMLRAVGYSMLGVFGTIFIFQFNFLSAILVGCMLLATTVQLFGFVTILGLKLNGFSLLNLSCAVGLGVELSAYVSYSYLRHNAMSDDPDERMKLAVSEMFAPMFQSSVTGFISVIVLNFTKYPFFGQYYFQMVSLMILLAFLNGIWFLPIILSLVNPIGLGKQGRMKSLGAGADGDKFVDDGL